MLSTRKSNLATAALLVLVLMAGVLLLAAVASGQEAPDEANVVYGRTNAAGTIVLYFKPGQEHSEAVLRQFADLQKDYAGKNVQWVGMIPDGASAEDARRSCANAGTDMEIMIDRGGAWFGRLRIVLEPTTIVFKPDGTHSTLPFAKINYPAAIRAHIAPLLHTADQSEAAQDCSNPPRHKMSKAEDAANRRLKLARRLLEAKLHQRAEENVEVAIALNPTSAAAYVLLAQVRLAERRTTEAARAFAQAIQLDPANAEALAGIAELQRLSPATATPGN